jgi:hypothetical protein
LPAFLLLLFLAVVILECGPPSWMILTQGGCVFIRIAARRL